MNRQDFYDPLLVSELHLNRLQDDAEGADRALVLDHLGAGIAYGLQLAETSPAPDLQLTVTAGAAYDALGRRVAVPADGAVDLSTDHLGASTAVAAGNERYVSVYLRFVRTEDEPYSDPAATPTTGHLRQEESFELLVVAGTEAALGAGVLPAPPTGNPVLLGTILRTNGQTQVFNRDVMLTSVSVAHRAADVHAESIERVLECSPTNPPSMSVLVAGGRVLLDGTSVLVATGPSPALVAPAGNPRIDLVYVTSAGALAVRQGTEAASPSRPSVRGVLPVAFVGLSVGQVAIEDGSIEDARPWFQAETGTARVHRQVAVGGEALIALPFSYTTGAHALMVTVNGAALDETEYAETTASSITLGAALIAADVLVVRALEVQPLGTVALEQVTDDLSGLLLGAEVVAEDRGAGMRLYVSPLSVVLAKRRLATVAESTVVPGALAAATWHYLYAYNAGGAVAFELSVTPPDASRVFKSGDTSRRYLASVRTDGAGVPWPFRRTPSGTHRWRRTAMATVDTEVLSAGMAAVWTDVSLAALVPPHARLATVRAMLGAPIAGGNLELRTRGTAASSLNLYAPATAAGTIVREELELETDSTQQVQYQTAGGGETATLHVVGWQE